MINITISKNGSERKYSFPSGSSYTLEVIPTIMKSPEIATGSFFWVDSGIMCKTAIEGVVKKCMAPISVRSFGISDSMASTLFHLMQDKGGMHVINSEGEPCTVVCSIDAHSAPREKATTELSDPCLSGTVEKIELSAASSDDSLSHLIDKVDGYKPKTLGVL